MTAPNFAFGPMLILFGLMVAVGFAALVLVLFAAFTRWEKRDRVENQRQGFELKVPRKT